MYYRIPKEYFIPVVTGDIAEEYMGLNRIPLEDGVVEKKALEEADKEFIESQIKGDHSLEEADKEFVESKAIGYFSEGYEYFQEINEYIE